MASVLGSGLVREISDEEIETFWRDGVVCLRGVIDPAWLETLAEPIDRLLESSQMLDLFANVRKARRERGITDADDTEFLEDLVPGGVSDEAAFRHVFDSSRADQALGRFATESMLPEIAGRVLRADHVVLYNDQLLVKEPGTPTRTAFHVDEPYFNVTGDQIGTCWVPLDVVTRDSGAMGYVRGSHRWTENFMPNNFTTGRLHEAAHDAEPGDRLLLDIDRHPDDYDIIYHELGPGDVTVHHCRTAHGSGGNTTRDRRRRALAIRYCGDDARYLPKPTAPSDNSNGTLREGQPLTDTALYAKCWVRS